MKSKLYASISLLIILLLAMCIFSKTNLQQRTLHQTIKTKNAFYELYLPESYSAKESYPLVVCLSPDGNGKVFYKSLYPVCNKLGCIMACSNDFRNDIPLDSYSTKS